jgi:uncharacterized protein (TIGR00290 family)
VTVPERVLMAWSGGKDSALALHEVLSGGECEIAALFTTVTEDYDRISMHGVRTGLLEAQSESIGLPLDVVLIPSACTNEIYAERMRAALERQIKAGVRAVAFGDVFLADVRRYREENLAKVNMTARFPLWGRESAELAHRFIDLGFRAILTCVDTQMLDGAFAGRDYDEQFLADLPEGVDPLGENGEFHSFVHAGPIFREPVACRRGEIVLRDERFNYCDVLPA